MLPLLLLTAGCHPHGVRIASPQIDRQPGFTCIIVIDSRVSEEVAKDAINTCKEMRELEP